MSYNIYWVGPRKADISHVKDINFAGSVTIFGDGKDNNYPYCLEENVSRVNHNVSDVNEDKFFYNTIKSIIDSDDNARFYFYNQNAVYYIEGLSEFKDKYFIAVNDEKIENLTNDKREFQSRLQGKVDLLYRISDCHRSSCDYKNLAEMLGLDPDDEKRIVVQARSASGGNGTFLFGPSTDRAILNYYEESGYIISEYMERNIPINIHVVIFDNKILLSPGSIQIMKEDDNRLLYRGADYLTYRTIPLELRRKFESDVRVAAAEFQAMGYRGVCGFDAIICDGRVTLLEINNRFQASSGLLNTACELAGIPSLQRINLGAFNIDPDTLEPIECGWREEYAALEDIEVNFSNYFYTDNGTLFHSRYLYDRFLECATGDKRIGGVFELEDDGFDRKQGTSHLAYLYRVVFDTNITSLDSEYHLLINENVCEPHKLRWADKISVNLNKKMERMTKAELRDYLLRLKIALLVQGVVITPEALAHINERNGLRVATNNAIDIRIEIPKISDSQDRLAKEKYIIINAPTDVEFVGLSPFSICLEDGKYHLRYYGDEIVGISIYPRDNLQDKRTEKDGISYSEVAFLSTDRLRVHVTNSCIFKGKDKDGGELGCKFCNICPSHDVIDLDNVREVVSEYWENRRNLGLDADDGANNASGRELGLTHFLVGGQTAPDSSNGNVVEVIRIIRSIARYAPIYAMVVPYAEHTLRAMYDAGLNQLACNIEVFDDALARQYMPGKRGKYPAEVYFERLSYATRMLGRSGNVRSMVIVGLEPHATLMEGIERLATLGIQPILSIFRPLPDTEMSDLEAPSMLYLERVYNEAQQICRKHGLFLGPECVNCQNNTLALPFWLEK